MKYGRPSVVDYTCFHFCRLVYRANFAPFLYILDYVLVPAPAYSTYLERRAHLKCHYVHTDETGPDGHAVFKLTLHKVAAAYEEAIKKVICSIPNMPKYPMCCN